MDLEKDYAEEKVNKYQLLLKEITDAENFILSSDENIIRDIIKAQNWINYKQLQYVYKMNGLF